MADHEKHDQGDSASGSDAPVPQKTQQPSGILGFFSRLGNLPEWKFGNKKLEGKNLNWSIGIVASCGFLMFGYDQGVMSALLTLDGFQRNLPLMTPFDAANPVCFFDSGERNPAMCTGDPNTQAAGVANGMATSTIPTWQSECARASQRGKLITLSGALIRPNIFAIFNGVLLLPCVLFFFPEPKGRTLEEIDVIFASAHADKVNPVKRAKEMPKLEGRQLESELIRYFDEGSTAHVESARGPVS